jgi:hypothetical protein
MSVRLINFPAPKHAPKAVRRGSKTETIVKLCSRAEGVTLTALAKAISKTGSVVTPQYCRAWVAQSYLSPLGYGLRSEVTKDGKDLRVFLVTNGKAVDASRGDVAKSATKAKAKGKRKQEAPVAPAADSEAA